MALTQPNCLLVGALLSSLEILKSLLHLGLILIPSHVCRATNKVVDKLANEGVALSSADILLDANSFPVPPIFQQYLALADSDRNSPDGVPRA
jgi:hypothetical protein